MVKENSSLHSSQEAKKEQEEEFKEKYPLEACPQ
jgi:hypothetical protein